MERLLPVDRQSGRSGSTAGFGKEETNQSIGRRFESIAAIYADRLAVRAYGHEVTYGALNAAASRIAHGIRAASQDRVPSVAVLCDTGIPGLAGMLGALKSGKAFVPLDLSYPTARLAAMLDDSAADVILADRTSLAQAQSMAGTRQRVLSIEGLQENAVAADAGTAGSPDSPACILYTSGSTGEPKGIVHSHRTALHYCMKYTNALRICADDRLTMLFSFSFGVGMNNVLSALLNGASLHPWALARDGVAGLVQLLVRERISIYHSVPTVFRHLVTALTGEEEFPELRLVNLSGESVYRRDVELYRSHFPPACVMVNSMGATEVNLVSQYFIDHEIEIPGSIVPVGYAAEDTTVQVLDDEGREVSTGDSGEIVVTGRYLSRGYWRRPELTAQRFRPVGRGREEWAYRTGDVGRMLPDGCLVHLGRRDLQVKVRGHRIDVGEVEAALMGMEGIAEAVVVARESAGGHRRLVAYVVPAGHAPTVNALRRALAARLPPYMVPSAFLMLDALPQTVTGKVDRRALPEVGHSRPALEAPFAPPRGPIEEALAGIWSELLAVERVGVQDNFFDVGGDSLLTICLLSRLHDAFGVDVELDSFVSRPTVSALAAAVEQAQAAGTVAVTGADWAPDWPALVAVQPCGSRPPLFLLSPGLGWEARDLSRHLGPDQPVYALRPPGRLRACDRRRGVSALAAHYISEVVKARPEGPYVLAGGCSAGILAFDMAQQLTARGASVPVLMLFDADFPPPRAVPLPLAKLLLRLPRTVGRFQALSAAEQRKYVRERAGLWSRQLLKALWRRLRGRPAAEAGQGVCGTAAYWFDHSRLLGAESVWRYVPQPYSGRLVLYLSEGTAAWPLPDRRLGWRRVAAGGYEVRSIPGWHEKSLEEPHVRVAARHVSACIRACTARRSEY